jgi:GH15 family glucan-1,4-alpha-glucosidase
VSRPIEDYALLADTQSAALVSRDASIDWMCLPRFDSPAMFASLLGGPEHGHWQIAPDGVRHDTAAGNGGGNGGWSSTRRYRDRTWILETEFRRGNDAVRVTDFMPVRDRQPNVVRVIEGLHGRVAMHGELVVRFDYGHLVPWMQVTETGCRAIAGPDGVTLHTAVPLQVVDEKIVCDFTVAPGERLAFVLMWHPSHEHHRVARDVDSELERTQNWWQRWCNQCTYEGPDSDIVLRSLLALKALTYGPTGGIIAAATTSLPEDIGGERNWDYRYGWLRDATFTLHSLLLNGFEAEANAWRNWLLRAIAGDPAGAQIMYGPAGERRLTEWEVDWLPGYEGSRPVRIGNAATEQLQIDVYGEVMDALTQRRELDHGLDGEAVWQLQLALLEYLEGKWHEPDEGIWEVRGPRRDFTHSKVMAWVAFDRGASAIERFGLPGDAARFKARRDEIHAEVCTRAYDETLGAFTQSYDNGRADAALLMMPLVGFLPIDDPRVERTITMVTDRLDDHGFLQRYEHDTDDVDGLPGGEGAFLPCTFWLADCYALAGKADRAREVFDRASGVANDLGLLAEEYDVSRKRLVGNYPQAFSHVSLVNTARNLTAIGPAHLRARGR